MKGQPEYYVVEVVFKSEDRANALATKLQREGYKTAKVHAISSRQDVGIEDA